MTQLALPLTLPVQDLDQFVTILTSWHNNRVAQLKHILLMPSGSELLIGDEEPLMLTGEVLKAYQVGIEQSLALLGQLPFAFETEDSASIGT